MTYAGYRRVSRVGDRDERLRSPDFQADRIKDAAKREGVEVEMFPPELDVSGGKESREILDEILERIHDGSLDGIIVAQFDRLSRLSMVRALALLERIESAGGRVISAAEPLDAGTPEGEFTRNLFLNVSNMERQRKAAGFEAAKAGAAAAGIWSAPKIPLGYFKDPDTRRLVPDPTTAATVRECFELRAAGGSWASLARLVGPPTDERTVQRMIRSRVYLGEVKQGKHINPAAHPPIIDRALWESAQREVGRPTKNKNPRRLLAGLCRCSTCGRAMSVNSHGSKGNKSYSYTCSYRTHCEHAAIIKAETLEDAVTAWLLEHLRQDTRVIEATPRSDDLDTALIDLAEAERLLSEYSSSEVQAALSVSVWAAGLTERSNAIEGAGRRVAGLRNIQPVLPPVEIAASWDGLQLEERRRALDAVGVAVVVFPRGTDPRFTIAHE